MDFDADFSSTLAGSFTLGADDIVFGWHLVFGINVEASKDFFWGVENKVFWTREGEFQGAAGGSIYSFDSSLSEYIISGKIGYNF